MIRVSSLSQGRLGHVDVSHGDCVGESGVVRVGTSKVPRDKEGRTDTRDYREEAPDSE